LVIGLDCAAPELVFERYRAAMPNVTRLAQQGTWGKLRSTVPPITVPAWACMFSGRDPGMLGVYGFRKREPGSYALSISSSNDLQAPMIWERLAEVNKRCVTLFVPPSYPPRAVPGELVSCFLTPDADSVHTSPPELAAELRERFGPYMPDVDEYRDAEPERLLAELYALADQHFAIALHMLQTRSPDLLAMVEIGLDRFHHAFFAHIDPAHPAHVPGNRYADEGRKFYAHLDAHVGRLLAAAGPEVNVLVVSDHGARPLLGGIAINEWLIARGYLVLKDYPKEVTPLSRLTIDFARTRAWAEGGYSGRVFLNVRGREPEGCVEPHHANALRDGIALELAEIPGPRGEHLEHRIETPEQSYRRCLGMPPDLSVFFGDLAYRAIGTVGHRSLYTRGNDTGFDAANHAWDGIFVMQGPDVSPRGHCTGLRIYDVAATLGRLLGLPDDPEGLGLDRSGPA
jgi:predicted AlkP superfamily phosphohydrolase/phosphomutase